MNQTTVTPMTTASSPDVCKRSGHKRFHELIEELVEEYARDIAELTRLRSKERKSQASFQLPGGATDGIHADSSGISSGATRRQSFTSSVHLQAQAQAQADNRYPRLPSGYIGARPPPAAKDDVKQFKENIESPPSTPPASPRDSLPKGKISDARWPPSEEPAMMGQTLWEAVSEDGSPKRKPSMESQKSCSDEAQRWKLNSIWARQNSPMHRSINTKALTASTEAMLALEKFDEQESIQVQQYDGSLKYFIAIPNSHPRIWWDLLGAFFIFYDLLAIPLQVFDPPHTLFTTIMDWSTTLFWTANIPASVLVGYAVKGQIVMLPEYIIKHYLKGWFLIDILVVVPDWIFTFVAGADGGAGSAGETLKMLRILRLLRMARLLRLMKLRRIADSINDMIDSEYWSIFASIGEMLILLLSINHFICCGWYFVGTAGTHTQNWVDIYFHIIDLKAWEYCYLTSLHWSLTQFTPASMDVQPTNTIERLYAVVILIFGLVGFSYVVGSITGSLTQLRSMSEQKTKQFWSLRRYMKNNHISAPLSVRIKRYLEHAWRSKTDHLQMTDIKILHMLSEQLTCELQCELSIPHLSIHPFFHFMSELSTITMNRLSTRAVARKLCARSDLLFIHGEQAVAMYIIVDGKMHYHRVDSKGETFKEEVQNQEDWIAEPVLWAKSWIHLGELTASTECDLMLIYPKEFGEILSLNPSALQCAVRYAENFMEWLNLQSESDHSDVSQGEDLSRMLRLFVRQDNCAAGYDASRQVCSRVAAASVFTGGDLVMPASSMAANRGSQNTQSTMATTSRTTTQTCRSTFLADGKT